MIKVEAVYSNNFMNAGQRILLYKTVLILGIPMYTYINADYKPTLEQEKAEKQIHLNEMEELQHA